MPRTIVIESLAEFKHRHGSNPMPLEFEKQEGNSLRSGDAPSQFILPDGATYNDADNPSMFEPPNDKLGNLRARLDYATSLLNHIDAQWVSLNELLENQARLHAAGGGPLPGEEDLQAVVECRNARTRARTRYEALKAEWERVRPETVEEKQAKDKAIRKRAAQAFLDKLYTAARRDPVAEKAKVDEALEPLKEALTKGAEILNEGAARNIEKINRNRQAHRQ